MAAPSRDSVDPDVMRIVDNLLGAETNANKFLAEYLGKTGLTSLNLFGAVDQNVGCFVKHFWASIATEIGEISLELELSINPTLIALHGYSRAVNARKSREIVDVKTPNTGLDKLDNDRSKHRLNVLAITRSKTGENVLSQGSEPCTPVLSQGSEPSKAQKGGSDKTGFKTLESVLDEGKGVIKKPGRGEIECKHDVFEIAIMFAGASSILNECLASSLDNTKSTAFMKRALSNRCRTTRTMNKVCRFTFEFIQFAHAEFPPLPISGPSSQFTIVAWLDHIRERGPTLPHLGRYCLLAFSEALGIDLPVHAPAVRAAALAARSKPPKSAEGMPLELVLALQHSANDPNLLGGVRLAASFFCLMTFASLRFSDTKDLTDLWVTETAICGKSVNHKSRAGHATAWAAPLRGCGNGGNWHRPILDFWEQTAPTTKDGSPPQDCFRFLFPHMTPKWEVNKTRAGTHGTTLAALRRLEKMYGMKTSCTLHSPRAFLATCANQLSFPREEREKLGRWAPGSVMPERYDRATCTTELRLRDNILAQIQNGWKPTRAYEVPSAKPSGGNPKRIKAGTESSSVTSTSVTSSASREILISELYD